MAQGPEARARRVQRRDEVKARLGAAMLDVARDRPFSTITVEEIARAAGISRSTFYFYYRDKGDLLVETAHAVTGTLFEDVEEYWQADGDPRELVRGALRLASRTFAEHADLIRVTIEVSTYDEHVGSFWQTSLDEFATALANRIRRDQEAGAVDGDLDAARFADALVAATQAYLSRTVGRNGDSPTEVAAVLEEIWIRVLYPG